MSASRPTTIAAAVALAALVGSPVATAEIASAAPAKAPVKTAKKAAATKTEAGKDNENCGNGRGKGGAEGAGKNQHGQGNTCGKDKADKGQADTPGKGNADKPGKGKDNENCGNGRGKGGAEGAGKNEHGQGNTCGKDKGADTPAPKPTEPTTPKPTTPTTPGTTPTAPTAPASPAPTTPDDTTRPGSTVTPPKDDTTRPGSTVTPPRDDTTRPGSTVKPGTPAPKLVTRTFQVDRYMPKTAAQARVVARLDDDGKLRYREDKPLWGASRWQFVTVSVPVNATADQVASAINAKTSSRVGDLRTGARLKSIKAGNSVTIAWELGRGATPTLAWGAKKNVNQTFAGRS